jgi:GT2 family glycosyltransferase
MADAAVSASVVIPCFNYGRFVGAAIESALRQTRPPREVIVVDDGSTDDSHEVIARFGNRVRAVFKENGGHASAFNAGCRRAEGDVVFLLDADDELCPEAIATMLAAWRPDTVLMHCRPGLMDAAGRDLPGSVPAPWVRLDEGDVVPKLLATGGFSTTVTSGLALRRDALCRVLPIPEERFRQGADGFLVRAIAFLGPVQAVDQPLARYRRHGDNHSEIGASPAYLAANFRKRIALVHHELDSVRELARARGLAVPDDMGEHEPDYLFQRLCSLAIDPRGHPIPLESRTRLLARFLAAQGRAGGPAGRRLAMSGLALAVVGLPDPIRSRLLAWWHSPAARPAWLSRLASRRRGAPGARAA